MCDSLSLEATQSDIQAGVKRRQYLVLFHYPWSWWADEMLCLPDQARPSAADTISLTKILSRLALEITFRKVSLCYCYYFVTTTILSVKVLRPCCDNTTSKNPVFKSLRNCKRLTRKMNSKCVVKYIMPVLVSYNIYFSNSVSKRSWGSWFYTILEKSYPE